MSKLTFLQYQAMDNDEKNKIQNRVRQWSLKARESLPKDHGLFCLVVSHLLKNAHRYFSLEHPSELQTSLLEEKISEVTKQKFIEDCKDVNRKVREIRALKSQNRVCEQKELVNELKLNYHSLRNMSFLSGISVKTVHSWCSLPKAKQHKSTELRDLRMAEFEAFLNQDTISFEHPSKKYSGKRFLRDTLEVTRSKYLQQPQYHNHGIISMSSMKKYRPRNIILCGKTPLNQCLCDKCENTEQLIRALIAVGVKNVPSN